MTSRAHPEKPGVMLCQTWAGGLKDGEEFEMVWPPIRPAAVRETLDVATASDWDLVLAFNHGSRTPQLSERVRNRMMDLTWALQDGYGIPGFMPEQGWDWSGIRDSTGPAKTAMADAIRYALTELGITSFVLDVEQM